jgi:O-antigen ligase
MAPLSLLLWLTLVGALVVLALMRPRWACFAAPAILTVQCPVQVPYVATVSLSMVLGAALAVRMVLDRTWSGMPSPRGAGVRAPLVVWGSLIVISILSTMADRAAVLVASNWFVGIAFYIAFTRYCDQPRDVELAVKAIVIACAIQAAIGLIEPLAPMETVVSIVEGPVGVFLFGEGSLSWRRGGYSYNWRIGDNVYAFGTFINAIGFASFVSLGVSVLAGRLTDKRGFFGRVIILCFLLAAVVLSLKRSAWVGLAGVAVVATLMSRRHAGRWLVFVFLAAGLVALISPPEFGERMRTIIDPSQNLSRLFTYAESLRLVASHPVFGVGIGQYGAYAPEIPAGTAAGFIAIPTENTYLTVATELGLVGLVSFLWLFGSAVRLALTLSARGGERWSLGLGALFAITWFLCAGLTADVIDITSIGVLFIIFALIERAAGWTSSPSPVAGHVAEVPVAPGGGVP